MDGWMGWMRSRFFLGKYERGSDPICENLDVVVGVWSVMDWIVFW